MKLLLKKMALLFGGAVAILGFGSQAAQASPANGQTKFQGVTEKSQLVLTQAAQVPNSFLVADHYSHSSHASHSSHHSHYSSN
jgi:hypothetical protein